MIKAPNLRAEMRPRGVTRPSGMSSMLIGIEYKEAMVLDSIRRFSKRCIITWQRIPGLAWKIVDHMDPKVDDKDVYDHLYRTCTLGLWPIAISDERWYTDIWVDCATGDLVSADDPRDPASDEDIRILYGNMHHLDPTLIIRQMEVVLRDDMKRRKPVEKSQTPPWVISLREEGGVPEIFSRKESLPKKVNSQLISGN